VTCKFYGCAAVTKLRVLVPTGGNQCALITESHAPCRMEVHLKKPPVLEECELYCSRRALEFDGFTIENPLGVVMKK
jgi:hypothetical protein